MMLWLLRPKEDLPEDDNPWDPWFDKVFGFVIRADSEMEARVIANGNAGDENYERFSVEKASNTTTPWLESKYSTCEQLNQDGQSGMILRDFCAA